MFNVAMSTVSQPSTEPQELSLEAWANLDEDTPGELVDGRLEDEEMPTALHELIAQWIATFLRNWAAPLGGVVFGSELKLAVRDRRGRKADVSAYLAGRPLPARSVGATRRPPTLAVEVLSPRPRDVRRDTVEKLAEYASFGITYYWIIDPLARTLEIRELRTDGRHVTLLAAAEGAHPVPGCEGLVIDLGSLWAECDRLPEDEDGD
jgi:Uma2 family endonuclease